MPLVPLDIELDWKHDEAEEDGRKKSFIQDELGRIGREGESRSYEGSLELTIEQA